jgi:hypothetical protein
VASLGHIALTVQDIDKSLRFSTVIFQVLKRLSKSEMIKITLELNTSK